MGITWCETTRDGDWDGTRRGGGTLLNTILTPPPVWGHSNDPGESCSKQWISNVVPCRKH